MLQPDGLHPALRGALRVPHGAVRDGGADRRRRARRRGAGGVLPRAVLRGPPRRSPPPAPEERDAGRAERALEIPEAAPRE